MFANSIDECTDTTKLYVLPDGHIYAYMRVVSLGGQPLFNNLADPNKVNSTPSTAINADEWLNGYYVSSKSIATRANCVVTNKIHVTLNDTIRIKGFNTTETAYNGTKARNDFKVLYCDESGNALMTERKPAVLNSIEGSGDLEKMDSTELENGIYCFTPKIIYESYLKNVAYVRICGYPLDDTDSIIITVNEPITYSEATEDYQWTNTGHAFVPTDYEDRIIELEERVGVLENDEGVSSGDSSKNGLIDNVDILLPASDVAVVGREYNIYKNTIVFSSLPVDNYDIVMQLNDTSVEYYNYHDVWRFTPAKAGTYTLTVKVRDIKTGNNDIYATKTMTLYVVENTAMVNKNVLFIGDSLTAAGIYTAEIQNNLSGGEIMSVGTIETTRTVNGVAITSKHEGRNGWATWDYAGTKIDSTSKFLSDANVFRNPDTNKFDLGYYMDTYHSGVTLDAVCLNLGTNGIGAQISVVTGMDELITRIREYSSTLPILIHIPIPVAPQDYRAYLTYQENASSPYMRMRWYDLAKVYIDKYEGTMSGVYLMPVYLNMDTEYDFPTQTMVASARNPTQIKRITDGHPNTYGYLKMADVYFANLLYRIVT